MPVTLPHSSLAIAQDVVDGVLVLDCVREPYKAWFVKVEAINRLVRQGGSAVNASQAELSLTRDMAGPPGFEPGTLPQDRG